MFESHPASPHNEQRHAIQLCTKLKQQKRPTPTHSKCKLTQLHVQPYQNTFLSIVLVFLPGRGITELTLGISPSSGSRCLRVSLSHCFPQFSAKKTIFHLYNKLGRSFDSEPEEWSQPPSGITEAFHCPSVNSGLEPVSQDLDGASSGSMFTQVVFPFSPQIFPAVT